MLTNSEGCLNHSWEAIPSGKLASLFSGSFSNKSPVDHNQTLRMKDLAEAETSTYSGKTTSMVSIKVCIFFLSSHSKGVGPKSISYVMIPKHQ